jgi:prepilin-type processing-associated H-X9-DG protein
MLQYEQDYDEMMPIGIDFGIGSGIAISWKDRIYSYVKSTGVFQDPDYQSPQMMDGLTGNSPINTVRLPASYVGVGGVDWNAYWDGHRPLVEYYGGPAYAGNNFPIDTIPNLSKFLFPSTSIVVVDSTNYGNNASLFWNGTSGFGLQDHTRMSNYLFADGHVKAMSPMSTVTPINMWNIENTANFGDLQPGPANQTQGFYLDLVNAANAMT